MAKITADCLRFDLETAVTTARDEHSVSVDSGSIIGVTDATSDLEEDHFITSSIKSFQGVVGGKPPSCMEVILFLHSNWVWYSPLNLLSP